MVGIAGKRIDAHVAVPPDCDAVSDGNTKRGDLYFVHHTSHGPHTLPVIGSWVEAAEGQLIHKGCLVIRKKENN